MNSALYRGWVRHRRRLPVPHEFRYRTFQVYLDLDELDEVFRRRWLWSTRRPAPAWFRRADHLGDPDRPLAECARDLVEERLGRRPEGPIRLLTNLRYWGYCMNPVSFYYCFEPGADAGADPVAIVAEVHNTPWGERHCYVLACDDRARSDGGRFAFEFPKEFHVSPFMPMELEYSWRFTSPDRQLLVHMENRRDGDKFFDATLSLERRPVTGRELAAVLLRHPFETAKVIAAIYVQAAKLWLKRCPVFPHPKDLPVTGGRS